MASKDLYEAMNNHLNKELYSAYLYLAMAAHFESVNLPGFAAWMNSQAKEEYGHAMQFWTYIYDRGGSVTLLAIDQPPSKYGSPLEAFEQALAHEKDVTEDIHKLYARASDEKDYASEVFLQSFISEQVEEEKTASQIVETLKLVGDSTASLLMYDRELAQRGVQPRG
ncbi:MAG: ferritin [Actinomycetota bacterium]